MAEVTGAIQSLGKSDLQLMNVRRKSAGYIMSTRNVSLVMEQLQKTGNALLEPENYLDARMIRQFDRLLKIASSLRCKIEVKSLLSDWSWVFTGKNWQSIRSRTVITDQATVYGNLKRVGGASRRNCSIRIPDGRSLVYAKIESEQLARKLGKYLYTDVSVRGTGTFFVRDWSMVSMSISDFTPRTKNSFNELYQSMRKATGGGWDNIADPDEFLKGLR